MLSGFVGELVGGWISDKWRAGGGRPNQVYRTMFAVAALFATVSIFAVGYVRSPIVVVALLSVVLFFLRWCGVYWAIPSILATRDRAGFLGGCMNLGGNIAGESLGWRQRRGSSPAARRGARQRAGLTPVSASNTLSCER